MSVLIATAAVVILHPRKQCFMEIEKKKKKSPWILLHCGRLLLQTTVILFAASALLMK